MWIHVKICFRQIYAHICQNIFVVKCSIYSMWILLDWSTVAGRYQLVSEGRVIAWLTGWSACFIDKDWPQVIWSPNRYLMLLRNTPDTWGQMWPNHGSTSQTLAQHCDTFGWYSLLVSWAYSKFNNPSFCNSQIYFHVIIVTIIKLLVHIV